SAEVGGGLLAPSEPDAGDHAGRPDRKSEREQDRSDLAGADRRTEGGPVDRGGGVKPGHEPGGEGDTGKRPALLRSRHLADVKASLRQRNRESSEGRDEYQPDHEHNRADRERDRRRGRRVDRREVARSCPRGHRQRPDDAADRGKAGAAEALDEPAHVVAGYLLARYCSNVIVPSRFSGHSNRPAANWRLKAKGSGRFTSRLSGLRIRSHEVARLLKSRISGPPKLGSIPAGSAVTTCTSRAATSVGSTGWNCHANGTVASQGSLLM